MGTFESHILRTFPPSFSLFQRMINVNYAVMSRLYWHEQLQRTAAVNGCAGQAVT